MTGIILLLLSILAGFLVGNYMKRRVDTCFAVAGDLVRYVGALKLNIGGKQLELAKFNKEFVCSEEFRKCLESGLFHCFKRQRRQCAEQFFANLNCTGSQQLLQHLEFYESQFEVIWKETGEESKKSSVFVKLGILLGAMVGILFL